MEPTSIYGLELQFLSVLDFIIYKLVQCEDKC